MTDQSLKFLIDANSDQAVAQIKRAVEAVFGLGNATLSVNKDATEAYRQTQAATNALAGATAAAAERIRAGYEAQRIALDPLYASSRRYESALEMVNSALEAGVIKQAEANQVMALAETRYRKAGQAASVAGLEANRMGGSSSRMGFQIQNASYQISDFFTQVEMGTGVMRAAGQQLPQLFGGFGMWGAVIGGAISVLALLIPALVGSKSAMEDASKANTAFGQSFAALKSDIGEVTSLQNEYVAAVQSGNTKVIAAVQAEARARESILKLDILDAEATKKASEDAIAAKVLEVSKLQRRIDETKLDAFGPDKQAEILAPLKAAKAELERITAEYGVINSQLDLFNAKLSVNGDILKSIVDGTMKVSKEMDVTVQAAQRLAEKIVDGIEAMFGLRDAQPGSDWLSTAIGRVDVLWGKLIEAGKAAQIANSPLTKYNNFVESSKNNVGRGQTPTSASPVFHKSNGEVFDPHPKGGSSGSSGGSSSSAVDTVTSLQKAGTDALKAVDDAVAGVNSRVSLGLMSTAEGTKAIADAKSKAAAALADLLPKLDAIGGPAAKSFAEAWRTAIGEMSDGLSAAGRELSNSLSGDFESAFASFASGTKSGKDAFNSFAQSVIADLAKMEAQKFTSSFISPIFDSIVKTFFHAQGGVPSLGGSTMAFAKGAVLPPLPAFRNSIVERPTFFAMGGSARGMMGEAGTEAIMPLTRGTNGKLGVMAQGGGGGQVVNIINNHPNAQITQSKSNTNGQDIVTVMIDQVMGAVLDDFARGGLLSDGLSNSFGLNRKGY
ncbi:MAG: phage tail tape measure C-terminal domain-containing protein [Cypionkella sp.]